MTMHMPNPYGRSATIAKAASRLRGDRLRKLYAICESQKTISTRKLEALIDELAESDRLDGIHFRELADRLQPSFTPKVNPPAQNA